MGKVITGFTMSLDGFVAAADDTFPRLFDWFEQGDVRFEWPEKTMAVNVSAASAAVLQDLIEHTGAFVVGRRLFDSANGWEGRHPNGVPVFVVSHRGPEGWDTRHDSSMTTFVNDGVAAAVERAQAAAGDRWVLVAGANVAQQCLDLGLIDEIRVELVPVLLGSGIPFFANLHNTPVLLDDPTVVEGERVTHLAYRVRK
jgi:dihydrofolate reductase